MHVGFGIQLLLPFAYWNIFFSIATWKRQPGMLGLRFAFLKAGEENWLVDGTADWVWCATESATRLLRTPAAEASRHADL